MRNVIIGFIIGICSVGFVYSHSTIEYYDTFPIQQTPQNNTLECTPDVCGEAIWELYTASPELTYARSKFKHWTDVDGDCQDTRAEVLADESLIPVSYDESGCRVIEGLWVGFFTGKVFTKASQLDVDHLVPLKEAWVSGASEWTDTGRMAYANDMSNGMHLGAVSLSANRSKGDRGPDKWLPPLESARCPYVTAWSRIKKNWNLEMSKQENNIIKKVCIEK